jgi:4-hydroxyphenylpyruvate dioxygenase
MQSPGSIGIKRLEGLHYYVHDLERSRRFYTERMGFSEVAASCAELERNGRQASLLFAAGACRVLCSAPRGEGGRAARFLEKHPDGIGTLVFEVDDAEHAFRALEARGANPIRDLESFTEDGGTLRTFSIATPFGSATFRFVERRGYARFCPGLEHYDEPRGGANELGFLGFDHVTSNFETMSPAWLFLEHVLGFEPFWDIAFHTRDVSAEGEGSGLRSKVMWDRRSGVKLALNEPLRPFFEASQINTFTEEMRGSGLQHVALSVRDIAAAVRGLRARGVALLDAPGAYYDLLPERLASFGDVRVDADLDELRELGILLDCDAGGYLLQIFLKDSASLYGEKAAGPFFYELIERHGAQGFGGGNFRALFESIERERARATAAAPRGVG